MLISELKVGKDGSIYIPSEYTKSMKLKSGDQVQLYLDEYQGPEVEPELLKALMHDGILL